MAQRVIQMRQLLYEKLRELGTPGSWDHIIKQIGMFSYTGLTSKWYFIFLKYRLYCTVLFSVPTSINTTSFDHSS
ncbi:unnamed protein product [Echinostoma caproni]|uniref:aspartate transaminase n=1 Tax=Echinostoma caproni TaxID=27848 RepID=A0A183B3X5_9TREM|nr:unnamed protein product [Echinostoma caproni]